MRANEIGLEEGVGDESRRVSRSCEMSTICTLSYIAEYIYIAHSCPYIPCTMNRKYVPFVLYLGAHASRLSLIFT